MLVLDSTRKLQSVFAGAKTSLDCKVLVSWADESSTATSPSYTSTATNGTTAVDICASPTSGTTRLIKSIFLQNVDTGAVTVTIRSNASATLHTWFKCTLSVGDTLVYEDHSGWYVMDTNGQNKQILASQVYRRNILTRVINTSGAGAYVIPALVNAIEVELIATGGGGGGCSGSASNAAAAGGGGSGSYLRVFLVLPQATQATYSIGVASTGGSTAGGTGGTGADTSFTINGVTYTAKGGLGGVGMTFGTTANTSLGGLGVVPTNGNLNCQGAPGKPGVRLSGTVSCSGGGGTPLGFTRGTRGGLNTNTTGGNSLYGGGGQGANSTAGNQSGGTSGVGYIFITEYY